MLPSKNSVAIYSGPATNAAPNGNPAMHRNTARRLLTRLAARITRARARARCLAPSAGMGAEAMPRQLRWPWSGGYMALARDAGFDRIGPGCAPQLAATCAAPAPVIDEPAALQIAA